MTFKNIRRNTVTALLQKDLKQENRVQSFAMGATKLFLLAEVALKIYMVYF